MKKDYSKFALFALTALFLAPALALAHQPRITESRLTRVPDPEISRAYYGKLTGEPDVYIIEASEPFDLYVNVLVPDIEGQKKDVSAVVLKASEQIALLDEPNFEWKQFYEPFGADSYWRGPEYRARASVGTYEIRVWSSNNDSKYSLAIGETETFDTKETLNALTIIPELKKNFFNESPIGFIVSPFGWGLIVAMYLLAGIVGLALRLVMRKFRNPSTGSTDSTGSFDPAQDESRQAGSGQENIGTSDRLLRAAIGAGLLLLAITTTWNPILLFFSGFALFEVIFSWCGLYAVMGKNTCVPR